ncbi:MAG TPA: carboxylesterase family protein [Gemmatimonadaceae bacterium]|nr:carboxylesterase family protein [Gemmatimonadaceae bacterium]
MSETRTSMITRLCAMAACAAILLAAPTHAAAAHVVRIEIVSRGAAFGGQRFGTVGQYERIVGRAYGEVDPKDRRNAVIADILLAPRNDRGMVEYVATFTILRPLDASKGNGVLIHDMVNRGGKLLFSTFHEPCTAAASTAPCDPEAGDGLLLRQGYTILWSGWQGDLAPAADPLARGAPETVRVPVVRNADGSPITGPVVVRWSDFPAGTTTLALDRAGYYSVNAVALGAYLPVSLDGQHARLETHGAETTTGEISDVRVVPSDGWSWGDCTHTPFPGARDSTKICVRGGADPARLYQLVYTARDPLVLLLGFAAVRDVGSFFRYEARDANGTPNPLAGSIRAVIATGQSQSGNTQRTFIHYGFNEDDAGTRGRIVWDGSNPHIAARQNPINFRFARPGGAAGLYDPGSDAIVWWEHYADTARHRAPAGLLDRCRATNTCPKIFDTLGSSEFWGLRASPDFVGTDAKLDVPLPPNVRRYYIGSTTHGGGNGAFTRTPPKSRAVCALPDNPAPETDHERALLGALTAWVTRGTPPPPSRYPRLADGTLTSSESVAARFPRVPGAPTPAGMLTPFLEYDFGPSFSPNDMRGALDSVPPRIRRVLPSLVPRIDADGNEVAGVKSPLVANPLGTYTGWNRTASGFAKDLPCGFSGGFIPFAATRAERLASGDPRPSLEERYGTHAAYVRGVRASAEKLVRERLLLPEDAARIVADADRSEVLAGTTSASTGAQGVQGEPVRTRAGLVTGIAGRRPNIRAYLGIPFAAPPVDSLRWRAPMPVAAWKGARAADHFSASCIQGPNTPFGPWTSEFLLLGPTSEDCLYLNVWTGARAGARRPVLVYVYGGGFSSGSGDVPVYEGSRLAEKGLVVVNMNYRVGALGFLAHPELTKESGASGNYGLLDQVAALRWVHDNIAAFGGDPSRVTVAGQSAGAMSVFLLTASPVAKGLFQRAVIESGPGGLASFGVATARSVARPRAEAEKEGVTYAEKLGAHSLAELRGLPASKFIGGGRFGAVVDGRFLVEDPAETFAAGRQNDVPTLTGLNADEGSASPTYGKATADAYRTQVGQRYGERAAQVLAAYPAGSDEEARRAQIESGRDLGVAGLERLLGERARTAHTPAFAYFFDRAIPWPEHPEFGAFHTSEVPYVFGTLDVLQRPWTDLDRSLSRTVMSYWANFATTGDPNGAALPRWPAFTQDHPTVLRLGEQIVPRAPLAKERQELLMR